VFQVLDKKRNFLGIPNENSSFENSKIVIVPIPYEHTVSYGKGAKDGPQAILKASHYVEFYDEETQREIFYEYGIATLKPLELNKKREREALRLTYSVVKELLGLNKFIVCIGGEHTISQAIIKAYAEKYSDLSILHFDAHSDLRQEYLGNKYSHASVMARVCEILDPSRIVQVGIRAQCVEEAKIIREKKINTYYAYSIRQPETFFKLRRWEDEVVGKLSQNVFVSFDVDAFDPSIMPATGTPEPNGLYWQEVMSCLKKVGLRKNIVGFDIVEFAPIKGLHSADITAARLISKILNYALK
jgi:agmatinase